MTLRAAALTLLVALVLSSPGHASPLVAMPVDIQRKLGLSVQTLAAAHHVGGTTGYARVLDATPLAGLDADVATAAAAASASQAEAKRSKALAAADATVSVRAAEAAAAQARADAAKLALLRRRLGLEWGPALMTMSDARRSALIGQLAAGRTALVRIDASAGLSGIRGAVMDLGADGTAAVQILGPARVSDPRFPSSGLLGIVSGAAASQLGSGLTLPVRLNTGGAGDGVVMPRSAVLRAAGGAFAYIRRDPTHFERRALGGVVSQAEGLFAAGGFRPGESVVVSGASALYAAETAPKAEGN